MSLFLFSFATASDDCSRCHSSVPRLPQGKEMGYNEVAVGIQDKGQIRNYTGNMGDLANFHLWFQNSGHWPKSARDDRQYAFGLGLIVGINDTNVIETVSQALTKVSDWLPPDDAAGRHYSGEITSASDDTPFQASSDFRETWPYGFYNASNQWTATEERVWPGYYRVDVNSLTPADILLHPNALDLPESTGEFTSDRDIFSLYNDDSNSRGRVGIEVEQTAHSYGRPYAEDFLFWTLNIRNTSGQDLDSIHVGLYAKFRPDYDNHDYINFIDSDEDGQKDLVYVYDLNNTPNKTWAETSDPMGIPALRVYDTPNQMGITDFHHFARGVSPTTDEEFWELLTGDTSGTHLVSKDYYFHGNDNRIDDTDIANLSDYYPKWLDEESGVDLEGDGINFIVSCGPFDLEADSTVTLSLGLIMGDAGDVPNNPDLSDLMANVDMANSMYRYYFQGSAPPIPPVVQAVPGDRRANLYWGSEPSESSIDVLTQRRDFEGYKIFRSTDMGRTWGDIITDSQGFPAGYAPIAMFDIINNVDGDDPAYPQQLGNNSGLVHSFTDTNLINGVEYWYCVTAYDRGNQHPDSLEQSLMYPLGSSDFESHTVSVIPGVTAINLNAAEIHTSNLTPIGGDCDAVVSVEMVDPNQITDHGYKITINESSILSITDGDTVFGLGFTLVDTTENDTLFKDHVLSDESLDNLPIVDGFRITIREADPGIKSAGWTRVFDDTCTFDWRFESVDPDAGNLLVQGVVDTYDDWRITVTYGNESDVKWLDYFTGVTQDTTQSVPIKIEIITDPDNPMDVTSESWLAEFAIAAPWEEYRINYYSQLGWDLEPGGLGFNAASPGWYDKHVDFFILESPYLDANMDTLHNYMYLFTNNKPDTSIYFNEETYTNDTLFIDAMAPSQGDEFTIITNKNLSEDIHYTFGFTAQSVNRNRENTLSDIRVVPDPYIVTNIWETDEFGKKLQFNRLPAECTIKIFTLAGDLVETIHHNNTLGYEFWNMRNRNDQFIAPGVYLYHVKTPNGDEATGRFLVIK